MLKLPKMRIKDVGTCRFLLVLVFFSLLGKALEDRIIIRGLISGLHLNSASQDLDENLEEVLAANCGLELRHLKQVYEDLGFSVHHTPSTHTISLDDQALVEENVKRALSNVHPQIKESLFKCLCENRHIRPVSGQDGVPGNLYQKNLESVLLKANSRRYMAEAPSPRKSSGSTKSRAPAPAKSPASAKSPAPAPSRASAKSDKESGSKGSPSKDKDKAKGKDTGDELVIPIPVDGKDKDSEGSGSKSNAESDDKSGHSSTTLIIAMAATAGAVVVVVILLVICCRKCCGKSAGSEHKDDRPLLSLSMSDYSVNGSEKANNQSYLGNLDGKGAVSLDGLESATGTNTSSTGLKPPPGRAPVGGSGLPPLKPPPGRTDLLPPEGNLKPPPGPAGPPPPPPPKAPPPPPPKKPPAPPPPGPPPPPGKGGPRGPPPPPGKGGARPPPVAMKAGSSSDGDGKTKLKPFFWDKVTANPDESMVWNQIKAGSFQFNEEMIESLFGYAAADNKDKKKGVAARKEQPQYIQIIDQKKAQNLSILLRALNVTIDEVRDALLEGNELPSELLETLIRMAPTSEEELKLRLYNGPIEQLGPAERFLKVLVDIPFAIKRLESLLFMGALQEEAANVKEAFITLEAACKELRGSRLFLKLLEAVLKTGNRMNDGTYRGGAQAFKLDTLLKLSDVKGTDGKTTLLHFVVQEIVRSEGIRAVRAFRESKSISSIKSEDLMEDVPDDSEEHYRSLGLQAVSSLGSQLENVRKAANLDGDGITGTVAKLGTSLIKTRDFINKDMADVEEDKGFHEALKSFVEHAEGEVTWLLEEEKRIVALIKKTADYFHGNSGKEEGLRLFVIVRDFVSMLEKVCKEVKERNKWPAPKAPRKDPPSRQSSASETPRTPMTPDFRQKLFPAIAERRQEGSGSGSGSDSD